MPSEKELKNTIENCLPITISGIEYAEPEIVSESCESIPFVTIPTYKLTNFDNNSVVYMSFDKGQVAISKKNIPGLKCAVCNLCIQDASPFYRCNSTKMIDSNDHLKICIKVQELKKER